MGELTTLTGIGALREHLRGVRFVWALITPSILLLLGLATYSLASRLLEPAEFGRFAVALSVLATLMPFASLGAPVILVRHLAGAADDGSGSAVRPAAYLATLLASSLTIGVVAFVDLLPGHPLERWLSPGLAPIVALGAVASVLVDLRVSEYQASFHFRRQLAALAGAAVTRIAALGVVLSVAPVPDHRVAVASYVAGSVLVALLLVRSALVGALRHLREGLRVIRRDLTRIGLPITASGILAVLTAQIDTLVAAGFLGATDLAQYAVASRLSLIHVTAIGGLTAIALPVSATLARRGPLSGYARLSTRLFLPLGGVAVLASIALAPLAVRMLFGEAYQPSAGIFGVLSLGFLLNYAGNPLSQVLYMTHRGHIMVVVQLVQLMVFAAMAGYVAARWGGMGLAAARTVTNLVAVGVVCVVSVAVARRMPNGVQSAP